MKRSVKALIEILTLGRAYLHLEEQRLAVADEKNAAIDEMNKKQKLDPTKMLHTAMFKKLAKSKDHMFIKFVRLRKKEEQIFTKQVLIRLVQSISVLTAVLLIAWLIQFLNPSLGRGIQIQYYSVLGQLYPILLIAFYISDPNKQPRYFLSKKIIDPRKIMNANKKLVGVASILFGLSSSLIVLATGNSNTFFFVITIISLIITVFILFQNIARH